MILVAAPASDRKWCAEVKSRPEDRTKDPRSMAAMFLASLYAAWGGGVKTLS